MSVDLRNFIQINLKYFQAKPLNRVRNTAVLLSTNSDITVNDTYESYAKYKEDVSDSALDDYVKCFFNNGGIKLHIIGKGDSADSDEQWLYNQCCALDYTEIVITSDADETTMRAVQQMSDTTNIIPNPLNPGVESVNTLSGYKEKIFVSSIDTLTGFVDFDENSNWDNYIVKYGDKGIEMTVAAYLTQINLNDSKTIADYCYTIENLKAFGDDAIIVTDNDLVVELSNKNINLDTKLVNATRNIMGNTIGGKDIMNYFMHIVLTQTLSERLMTVLTSKIKYDKSGINKVINAMTQELDLYKGNGYLTTEDIWTEEDLYYNFNGVDYLVCKRNTPLTSGYRFTILPLSALTTDQKQAHAFPPIYVLISDSISIRQILISGDIY